MWRKLWRKHVYVIFDELYELKGISDRLKSVAVNKMTGDDGRTTWAGMSQIYAQIYAIRRCEMFRE